MGRTKSAFEAWDRLSPGEDGAPTNATRPEPGSHNAQRNYQRYLELARAEALTGNTVGAENYYQHAEHYFRSMSSDRETR
jgi:hypothetical protein